MDVKEEQVLGAHLAEHWYYISKGGALRQLIGDLCVDEVLDVGAGSGIFSRQLLDAEVCNRAVCIDPAYEEERDASHRGKPICFRRSLGRATPQLILMMDVLEHVDDDVALLRQYTGKMPSGTHVVISVPAFEFLWSGHDVFLEHRRRYTLPQVEAAVAKANLNVVKSRYFFGILLPVAIAMRLSKRLISSFKKQPDARSELKVYPPLVNKALTEIHELEQSVLFPHNTFAGLTVFCLATVP